MLNKDQIKHIAELARLELSEEETGEITPQLSDILDYIEQLREVDTTNVEATAQVTGQTNVFRQDRDENWAEDERAIALNQSPDGLEGGQIKVKRVLD